MDQEHLGGRHWSIRWPHQPFLALAVSLLEFNPQRACTWHHHPALVALELLIDVIGEDKDHHDKNGQGEEDPAHTVAGAPLGGGGFSEFR